MPWKVFGGTHDAVYLALLKERCRRDGLDLEPEVLRVQLLLHVLRGTLVLTGDREMRSIEALFERGLE